MATASLTTPPADRPAPAAERPPIPPAVLRISAVLARSFVLICTTAIAEAIAGHDLTPLQYAVLRHLDAEPGIDQNGLAARLGVDQSHVSLLLDQLIGMGLVDRSVNAADRRARVLHLSRKGDKLQRKLTPKTRDANYRVLSPLTASEREHFLDLFARVIEGNRELLRPGAGRRKRAAQGSPDGKSTKR